MRLQHKQFNFALESGDKPHSKLLTSKVLINESESDMILSDLFFGVKKERNGSIIGYSILEFLDENGCIDVNGKICKLTFSGKEEIFSTRKSLMHEPKTFVLNDKEIADNEIEKLENRIIESASVHVSQQGEQPPSESHESQPIPSPDTEAILFVNEDYNAEVEDLKKEGYVEYNTEPKSNMKLLVNENAENVLIEIKESDFNILEIDYYKIETNKENKTFSYKLNPKAELLTQ